MNALRSRGLLAMAGLATAFAAAALEVPAGRGSFTFVDARGRPDRPFTVHSYRPAACDARCPIVFVLHGMQRNASDYRDYWIGAADRYNVQVLAPEFAQRYWPRAAAYNLGDVAAGDDPEKWAFSAIEHLFDAVRSGQRDYVAFGHSAGGQFVHRMALFRPDHRAAVLVAANPGWYTMPEWRQGKAQRAFPYSLVGSRVGEAQLQRSLQRRLVLMLGEDDIDPEDKSLNNTDGAREQGRTRVERGERFFAASIQAAADLGVRCAWQLHRVAGTAHDGAAMSRAAADLLLAKP